MAVTKAMTLAQMRTYVRDYLDTDSTDLPDDLVDRWLIDGSNHVEAFSDHWKFRQVEEDFSTVSGTQHYVYSTDDGQTRNAGFSANISRIYDIRSTTRSLKPEDHATMRSLYTATTATLPKQTISAGAPTRFSTFKFRIYLWPVPNAVEVLTLNGYREPIDWVGTAVAPDFPAEFHELIALWGISQAYAREGDPGMSQFMAGNFFSELGQRAPTYILAGEESPLIVNGGTRSRRFNRSARGRLLYDWE